MSRLRVVLVLALVSGLAAGCAAPAGDGGAASAYTAPSAPPELARFNALLADLAERLRPGLVHVRVRRAEGPDDEAAEPGEPRERPRASGSGFVLGPDGLIVTNAHVVDRAASIQVRLADGRRFAGRIVGRDDRVDLAVVRIEGATGLTPLALGDSNRLRVGEFVLALGHPFGLEHSVSFGIVSRKGAPLTVAAPGFDFIQTDAAINPGNSGGPLVNMAGEVIGVNAMAARNGSIGFAIPSNLVRTLVPRLVAKGRIEWGWLGVSIAEVTEEDQARLKLSEPRGVLVREVLPGQPAEQAGLRPDDVILSVDGTPTAGPRDLQRVVSITPVGTRVRLAVVREGRPTEVEVTVGLYPERPRARAPRRPGPERPHP